MVKYKRLNLVIVKEKIKLLIFFYFKIYSSKIYYEFLCKDTINTAIQYVSKYIFTLQQLIKSVGKISKGFQEFFSWIHKCK